MSDKIQHTAIALREKMLHRYGDETHHKHNKNHLHYRQHSKSHPCHTEQPIENNGSTGLVRQFNLRKIRKRLDKGRIH